MKTRYWMDNGRVSKCADRVLELISSRPQTPSKDELMPLIARAMDIPVVCDEHVDEGKSRDYRLKQYTQIEERLAPTPQQLAKPNPALDGIVESMLQSVVAHYKDKR